MFDLVGHGVLVSRNIGFLNDLQVSKGAITVSGFLYVNVCVLVLLHNTRSISESTMNLGIQSANTFCVACSFMGLGSFMDRVALSP